MGRLIKNFKSEKEELLHYKGLFQMRGAFKETAELMARIDQMHLEVGRWANYLKPFASWVELGDMLGMTENQAQTYLKPLMDRTKDQLPELVKEKNGEDDK